MTLAAQIFVRLLATNTRSETYPGNTTGEFTTTRVEPLTVAGLAELYAYALTVEDAIRRGELTRLPVVEVPHGA